MRVLILGAAVCCALAGRPSGAHGPAVQEPTLDDLVDRLGRYLIDYESVLSHFVADEEYEQSERPGPGTAAGRPTARRLHSTVAFLRLPEDGAWFGVREVQRVDGRAVEGRTGALLALLRQPGADGVARARAIVEASARHNLSPGRTINMPTVPLELLSARHRSRLRFRLRGDERLAGRVTYRLAFEERTRPTLVRDPGQGDMWSRGSAWIEAESGRLWRAELIVSPDTLTGARRAELESRVRVDFRLDTASDTVVPSVLEEEFWVPRSRGHGRARYTNYRRFTTGARIVPG